MMKVGFSALLCPDLDPVAVAGRAKALGLDGVELSASGGENRDEHFLEIADPDRLRRSFHELGIEAACLGTSAVFGSRKKGENEENKALTGDAIELAAKLGCPAVRVFCGGVPQGADRYGILARAAEALRELAPCAARHHVTIVVENSGGVRGSDAVWFLLDSVRHPAVKACWNPCAARTVGERPTISIPRLAGRIAIVRVRDARFDDRHNLTGYELPGRGDAELHHMIQLLRGVAYDGYLILDGPAMHASTSGQSPDERLLTALAFLRGAINEEQKPLSAYKGDKNAPRFARKPGRSPGPAESA